MPETTQDYDYRIEGNQILVWTANEEDLTMMPDYEQEWFDKFVPADAGKLPEYLWRELYGDYLRFGEATDSITKYLSQFHALMKTQHHETVMHSIGDFVTKPYVIDIAGDMDVKIIKAATRLPFAKLEMRKSIIIRLNLTKSLNRMREESQVHTFNSIFVLYHVLILNAAFLLPEVLDEPAYPEVLAAAEAVVASWGDAQ